MKINPLVLNRSFGRALSSKEKESYNNLLKDSKKELGVKDTTAIVFDFNVPSLKGKNTAIGTTWGKSSDEFLSFVKDMTGISSIQLQPQGKITLHTTSPYSGSTYAYGSHIIDLVKLTTNDYGNLLAEKDLDNVDKNYNGSKIDREYKTDYAFVLGSDGKEGVQKKLLKKAFYSFQQGVETANPQVLQLKKNYEEFKDKNKSWLEKDTLFEALTVHYKTADTSKWNELDKNLYSNSTSQIDRNNRISELKNKYKEVIEFESFIQFIADMQQKESREGLNANDIKLYGDCLIGFSGSEIWANPDCFRENLYYGGPDPACSETNNIQTWGLRALDYTKLGECSDINDLSNLGEVGKFLYNKYAIFFERYDGVRIDAAWQFVTPFIYQSVNGNYEEVKLPEINYTIFNIMHAAAKNVSGKNCTNDSIMLELVGMSADKSREMTLNKYPHLYTTAYSEYNERPKKFIERGYKNGNFYVGATNHDNDSLINMAKDDYKRTKHMADIREDFNISDDVLEFKTEEYQTQSKKDKEYENYRTAKFAELFTSAKQFFTLPDMFGMAERINVSGKVNKNNWSVRIPTNYEKFYFSQLSKGFGLNIPKANATALRMQNSKNSYLIEKNNELAEILRSDGPMTEEEANIAEKNGSLKTIFEYK